MWCVHYKQVIQSGCIWNPITTTLTILKHHMYRDIYVGVNCVQLDIRSFLNTFYLYLVPILFFTSESSLHSLKFSLRACFFLLFGWRLHGHLKWFEFATTSSNTHSYIFSCSFVCLVCRHTPRSREKYSKTTASATEPESSRRLD